jgi:hypothetical protein
MKKQFIAILLLLATQAATATERVQITISKPFALLTFMRAAAAEAHVSATLIAYIHTHVAKQDSAKMYSIVRKFEQIGYDNTFQYTEYPAKRLRTRSVTDIINNAAIQSANTEQFLQRLTGILPNEQWQQLKETMSAIEPYYDKMMLPHNGAMEQQLLALQQLSDRTEKIFRKLKKFYGSSWSEEIPFVVSLYAIPGRSGNSTAAPYSNSLAMGVLTEEQDHEMRMAVAIHEMCHVLYAEQPLKQQWAIDAMFAKSSNTAASFAYTYIDEALATACGNGWAYYTLTGRVDTGEWYDNDHINRYAKAIYPLAKKYIEEGKTIDKAFINSAIKEFQKTFPRAKYEYENLLMKVNIYTTAENHLEFREVSDNINRHVRIVNSVGSFPVADTEVVAHILGADGTLFFVIHNSNKENYTVLRKLFPQLKDLDPQQEGIASFFDKANRPVIILNVTDRSHVEQAVLQMRRSAYIDPDRLFVPLQ